MDYHILIVDKDRRMRDLIRDILAEERADSKVATASSALEALKMMNRQPVDILITGWQMPHMDGLALIETVQLFYPNTHAILTTTADQDEIKERSRDRAAAFRLFVKPFPIASFVEHVDQVLRRLTLSGNAVQNAIEDRSSQYEFGCRSRPRLRPALSGD